MVREFLCHDSTFNLIESLDAGKVIVFHFDLSTGSKQAIKTIGQLINAAIASYAMSRPKGKRRPIHLFADECHYFVSPRIEDMLGETRKFGLYATLATQRTNQVGKPLLDAILGNVGCHLIGRNKNKTAKKMAEEHPISADDIRGLQEFEFFQIDLRRKPIKTKIPLVGNHFALNGADWKKLLKEQGQKYYQPNTAPTLFDESSQEFDDRRRPKFKVPDVSGS